MVFVFGFCILNLLLAPMPGDEIWCFSYICWYLSVSFESLKFFLLKCVLTVSSSMASQWMMIVVIHWYWGEFRVPCENLNFYHAFVWPCIWLSGVTTQLHKPVAILVQGAMYVVVQSFDCYSCVTSIIPFGCITYVQL